MSAKEIFDISLTLKMKEQMLVPVHNKQQQESLRVSLSYNRRMFLESTITDFDIIVSKYSKGEKYFVCLTKMPRITSGVILSPDGSSRTVNFTDKKLEEEEIELTPTEYDEDARIKKAMKADGYTDAQIDEYFSKPSNIDTLLEEKEE